MQSHQSGAYGGYLAIGYTQLENRLTASIGRSNIGTRRAVEITLYIKTHSEDN